MKSLRHIALLAILAGPTMAAADVLVLTDGTRLEGRVEAVPGSTTQVAFISGTGRIQIPTSRIRERIDEEDAMDYTRIGNQFLNSRNYTAAVRHYQMALEANADFEEAKAGLKSAQDAIAAEEAERNRQAQEALGKQMEEVDRLIEDEKFTEAEGILNRVLAGNSSEAQKVSAQGKMRDLYLAWGFSRYDRLDRRGAEEKYLRVLEMDPQNANARDKLLELWKDDPEKRPEVLKAYQEKLAENPNDLELNRIVADLLFDSQQFEAAIGPLKKVAAAPRYANLDYRGRLIRAYKSAIDAAAQNDDLDKSISLFEDMLTIAPGEDPTNLVIFRYEREKRALATDDYDGQALLAKKLYDDGLRDYARREAEYILRFDENNKVADSILRAEAQSEFNLINESFTRQDWVLAQNLALRFTRSNTRYPDLVERASEIYRRSEVEARRQAVENRREAQRLAEQGVQYYNEARRETDLLQSLDVRTDTRPLSNKQQAISLAQRSIQLMEIALELDPSLGPITGMDLTNRLRDARQLYNGLTASATPLPRARNR